MKQKILSVIFLSVIVVALLGSSTGSTEAYESYEDFLKMTDEVVILINEKRVSEGLKPMKTVPILRDAATVRANEAVVDFSHTRPGGLYYSAVLQDFSIFTLCSAENLAAGFSTPEEVVDRLMASPGHRANIMNPDFTHVGVGFVYAPHGDKRWYWSQIFIKSGETFYDEYYPQRYDVIPQCEGDITGDSDIDAFDLVLLRQTLDERALLNDLQIESADCLKDGAITGLDAMTLTYYINHKSPDMPLTFNDLWQIKAAEIE